MMRSSSIPLFLLVLAQALLPACDSDSTDVGGQGPFVLLGDPLVVDSTLLLVDGESDRAFLLDLSEDDLAATKMVVDLPPNPFHVVRRAGRAKEALILSAGRRGVSERTALSAVRVNGKIRTYRVSVPFDSLAQDEDGNQAVLYYSQGSEQLLSSLNEIAVVDLEGEVDDPRAVTRRSVDTPGGPPSRLQVSPSLALGEDDSRTLAVLLSESYATLVDLDDLERSETVVHLSSGEGDAAVLPEQMVFQPEQGAIYLRAARSDDVFAIRIEPDDRDEDNFQTAVEQLTVGTAPSDIAVYGEGAAARLLIVSENDQQVHIVDISCPAEDGEASSEEAVPPVVHIDLETAADSLLLFETEAPEDSDVDMQQHALLYRHGGRTLTFLDLLNAETEKEQNLESIRVGEPIAKLEPLLDQNLALIEHESSRIRVLDLEKRRIITTVEVQGSLYNAVFSGGLPRLWVAPPGGHFAGCVDLTNGDTEEVLLDHPLDDFALAPVPGLAIAIHKIEGDEEKGTVDSIGITVLDALDPDRDESVTLDNLLD